MSRLAPMFEGAIERGELPADADREEIFSMAAGPIYFRRFIASKEVDDDWVQLIVDQICGRYCLTP
jgi:hypothetical protein